MRAPSDASPEPGSSDAGRRQRLPPPPPLPVAGWEAAGTYSLRPAPDDLLAYAEAALAARGLRPHSPPVLLRHGPGDQGLPPLAEAGSYGFAIDLTEARRTLDGGLLLFVDEDGRTAGWRAEAGVLTLWRGRDPLLTEVAPGAPERLTMVGRATTR